MSERFDFIVVGGGLSGMVAAHQLAEAGKSVLVLEREPELGGLLKETRKDGFSFDIGGHWLHAKGLEGVADMFTGLCEHERHAFVYHEGRYGRFPVQAFYADVYDDPDQITAELTDPGNPDGLEGYGGMLRFRYGPTLYGRFFEPYNQKLFGREDLDSLEYGKLERVRNVRVGDQKGYNDTFLYPDGAGIASIIEDLKHPGVTYQTSAEVEYIDLVKACVVVNKSTQYEYGKLISTIPLKRLIERTLFAKLVTAAPESVRFEHSEGRILNLGVKAHPNHEGKTWVYYADLDLPFYRVGFYSNVDASKAPEGCTSMYVEVSTLDDHSMDDVVAALIDVGMLNAPSDVLTSEEVNLKFNYCFHTRNTEEFVSVLSIFDVYTTGRYGRWHWSSMHEDIRDAMALVEEVLK